MPKTCKKHAQNWQKREASYASLPNITSKDRQQWCRPHYISLDWMCDLANYSRNALINLFWTLEQWPRVTCMYSAEHHPRQKRPKPPPNNMGTTNKNSMDNLLKHFLDSGGQVPSFVWLQHAEASKESLAPSLMSVHLNQVCALHCHIVCVASCFVWLCLYLMWHLCGSKAHLAPWPPCRRHSTQRSPTWKVPGTSSWWNQRCPICCQEIIHPSTYQITT